MTCYWDHGTEQGTGRCIVRQCGLLGVFLNVPKPHQTAPPTITGNLLWTLHLEYLTYTKSMNQSMLARLVPLLQRAVNFHMHMAIDNGTLIGLPVTFSPEYDKDNNTNYDLALFRWGLQTLLQAFATLGIKGECCCVS
jgi:hypothetical protein